MSDILNPVGGRHPNQITGEGSNVSEETTDGYVEGTELIPLPSKGVFYNFDQRYINLDKLRVRQLNYTDEDILTTRSYLEDGSVFFEILKNVIVDDSGFPASALMPIDRDTILLWLRSTAFGNEFEAETNCPKCGEKQDVKWDLATFKIPEYDETIYQELLQNGELSITTPVSKTVVKISVPTIGRAREFEKSMAVKKKNLNIKSDMLGTGSMMLIVSGVEIDGKIVREKSKIEAYFRKINLTILDARFIRKSIEQINLQYDTKQNVECKSCGHIQEGVEMPMLHPNFFWPDTGI